MKKSLGAKTLVYPTPVWLVGSYDSSGKPNIMTIAWGGVCSSKPPCVAVSIRSATYTHAGIMERGAFTVNVPSESQLKFADYCGIASGRNCDKFAETGLTAVRSTIVDAPYVDECPLVLECRVMSHSEIGIHTHFIGEVMDVKADESLLDERGIPDIKKVLPIIYTPEHRSYYGVGEFLGKAYSVGKDIGK